MREGYPSMIRYSFFLSRDVVLKMRKLSFNGNISSIRIGFSFYLYLSFHFYLSFYVVL